MPASYESLPLIDQQTADEFFASQGNDESDAMQREIWADLTNDLIPDLESLANGNGHPDLLCRKLHRIRGYCLSCAMTRLAAHLYQWEFSSSPASDLSTHMPIAIDLARQSIEQIESEYPHLKPLLN